MVPQNIFHTDTFIYNEDNWSRGPNYPLPLKHSCATFLKNSDDVVYIFGGLKYQGVAEPLSDVTEYIISEGKYNHVSNLPIGLQKHACTANVDKYGVNVSSLYVISYYHT